MADASWNPYPVNSKEWYAHEVAKQYYYTDYNKYLDVYYSYIGTPVPGADQSKTIAEQYRELYPEQYQPAKQSAGTPWGLLLAIALGITLAMFVGGKK